MLVETIQSTQFHTGGDNTEHKAHNSALVDHITIPCLWRQYKAHSSTLVETMQSIKHTIPHLRITLQFHAREAHNSTLADHITIPRSWRQYKAHSSTLVETIQSTTFRARGSTQFCACGSHYDSTLMETIQRTVSTQFHAGGDNTEHKAHNSVLVDHITIPRSWKQYKAHSSTLVETIQSTTFHACEEHTKQIAENYNTIHTTVRYI